jgi:hypothetical protein
MMQAGKVRIKLICTLLPESERELPVIRKECVLLTRLITPRDQTQVKDISVKIHCAVELIDVQAYVPCFHDNFSTEFLTI